MISFAAEFGDTQRNLDRMVPLIEEAAELGAKLVCLPEIALQGYHTDLPKMRREAEAIDGPSCSRLIEEAQRHDLVVSVGMALREGERVFNAQVFLGPKGPLGYAPKIHLTGEEAEMFDAGDHWPVIDLGFAKVGTIICFDAEFPEAARCLALQGADVILMSFATGRCDSCGRPQDPLQWPDQVLTWAPARAYENRVFILAVNHSGDIVDDQSVCGASWIEAGATHRWPGYSFAVGPDGVVLAESDRDHNRERILCVDLEPDLISNWREAAGDFLHWRRPETYGELTSPRS